MIHSAFGLGLAVDRPLPRLAGSRTATRADVRITLGSMPAWRDDLIATSAETWHVRPNPGSPDTPLLTIWTLGPNFLRLLYGDGVDFLVARDGCAIWATWPETSSLDDMSSYLLGPILGFVLRLRGTTCLHASATVVDGAAIAFVGGSGAGKSTLAAAFVSMGHRALADDLVALIDSSESLLAAPAYPRLRLWPRALNVIGFPEQGQAAAPGAEERRIHVSLVDRPDAFQRDPVPLGAVYFLETAPDGPDVFAAYPVSPAKAMIRLTANTFANTLLDATIRAREFDVLCRLVQSVPVRRVQSRSDLSRLPELCTTIVDDFRRICPARELSPAK